MLPLNPEIFCNTLRFISDGVSLMFKPLFGVKPTLLSTALKTQEPPQSGSGRPHSCPGPSLCCCTHTSPCLLGPLPPCHCCGSSHRLPRLPSGLFSIIFWFKAELLCPLSSQTFSYTPTPSNLVIAHLFFCRSLHFVLLWNVILHIPLVTVTITVSAHAPSLLKAEIVYLMS